MESDMRSRINAARNLANDIARIGAQHGQQVSVSAPHGYNGISRESMNGVAVSHGGAVPVSAPEPSMGVPLRIIVTNQMAKEDLSGRLDELKQSLLDLCERQLHDLLDTTPTGHQQDIEDVDKLLLEMQTLKQGMGTIVAIQNALSQS